MTNAKVSVADVLFGLAAPTRPSFRNKIIGLITMQRVAATAFTVLPYVAGTSALAGGRFDDPRLGVVFILSWLVAAASLVTHDIVDSERDKWKWPMRPLASGLISRSAATFYAVILAGIGLVLARVIYSWLFAALVLLGVALGYAYVRYMRDNIGYLTLMLPIALFPLAVWDAFSPGTLLTPLPWLLVTFVACSAACTNIVNEAFDLAIPALFVRPRPSTERALYVIAYIITFFTGMAIFFYAHLDWLYLVVLTALTAWVLTFAKYLGEQRSPEMLKKAFIASITHKAIYFLSLAVFA